MRLFPDGRKIGATDREIKQSSQITNRAATKMLQVDHSYPVRPHGCRGFGTPNRIDGVRVDKGVIIAIQLPFADTPKDLTR